MHILRNLSESLHTLWARYEASIMLSGGLVIGAALMYWFMAGTTSVPKQTLFEESRKQGKYSFINPLLECEQAESVGYGYYRASFDDVQTKVDVYKANGTVTDLAVYFRDLNNGPWYSINEESLFEPASLFKLPLLVALYKKREMDPTIFQKKLLVREDTDEIQAIKPETAAKVGAEYTIAELSDFMIKYSDNNSAATLFEFLGPEYVSTIFTDLGLTQTAGSLGYVITVKNYSGIYRLLFNGSYLNKDDSEAVLKALSSSEYTEGLRKGLPPGTLISHKFGERSTRAVDNTIIYQLHDCGIVYYPQRPFLLCIMTKGRNADVLPQVIQDIANTIFTDFDQKVRQVP